jgi:hypothetical protein
MDTARAWRDCYGLPTLDILGRRSIRQEANLDNLAMTIFKVRPYPDGDFQEAPGVDEVDAAKRLLQMPLQRQPRSNMHLRALVRLPAHGGLPILLYAKDER